MVIVYVRENYMGLGINSMGSSKKFHKSVRDYNLQFRDYNTQEIK